MLQRAPLSPLSKVAALSITITALTLLTIYFLFEPNPAIIVVAPLSLLAAVLTGIGLRWAPALAAVIAGALLAAFFPVVAVVFLDPTDPGYGHVMLTALSAIVTVLTGAAATWVSYRRPAWTAPRWIGSVLGALFSLWLGATFVASLSTTGAAAAIAPAAAEAMLTVQTEHGHFMQPEIRVKAGQLVAVRLENQDEVNHTFTIDELGVNAQLPAKGSNVALFKADKPGTYTIYCIPHYNKKTGQGMEMTLIVEA